jgi:lysophospholipase L1-like esterase
VPANDEEVSVMTSRRVALTVALALALPAAGPARGQLLPGQSQPKRLYSNGDSITRAFDADFPADNLNVSWVNGYYGFWEQLFGLPNVKSHNQRISANWGSSGRTNTIAAVNGARIDDLATQAAGAAGRNVTYATVMLGGNDVCRDSIGDLPTDAEIESHFRSGMATLLAQLPSSATVQVVGIPNNKRLYDIGKSKTALGIADCEVLWALTVLGFPCGSMLSPFNSSADREYVDARTRGYNAILQRVTAELDAANPEFLFYGDAYAFNFVENEISNIDCFHPSWRGERTLSREIWNNGPFRAFTRGS